MTRPTNAELASSQGPAAAEPEPSGPRTARPGLAHVGAYSGLLLLGAVIVLFALWVPHTFLTSFTVRTLISEQAVTAIAAIGLLIPLAAGVFDLSIASMIGLAAMMVLTLMTKWHFSVGVAIVITLVAGAAVGTVNGFLVVIVGIDSFIATLGMSAALLAAAAALSGSQMVYGAGNSLINLTNHQVFGVPILGLYMVVVAFIIWYMLEHTPLGRRLAATGAGLDATRLAGVRTGVLRFGSLVTSALLGTIAGVLLASKLGAVTPDLGNSYLLPTFAAAFLGTTQLKPGRFNVWGTVVAIFLLATGAKGLQLVGAAAWVTDLFNGLALIVAVGLSLWGGRFGELKRRIGGRRVAGRASV
jgi:ribose transport system permease protein